jgi:hypothetical protein
MLVARRAIPNPVKREVLVRQARCFFCADPLVSMEDTVFVNSYFTGVMHAAHAGCTTVRYPVRTHAEKLAILARSGKCRACGETLDGSPLRFDHRPPLEERRINRRKTDFIPKQHDPDCIEAIHEDCHDHRTFGRKPGATKTVTTVGSDVHRAAKLRRMKKPKKATRKIQSRGFSKQRRKLQGRGFK